MSDNAQHWLKVIEWIHAIDDPMHPPTDERRMELRRWLAADRGNFRAFREHVALVMKLFTQPQFPRETHLNYRHFILEAIYAQVDATYLSAGRMLLRPTPVPRVRVPAAH